jgi:hypothetical protein
VNNRGLNSVGILHGWGLEFKSCLENVRFFRHFLFPYLTSFQGLQLLVLGNFCIKVLKACHGLNCKYKEKYGGYQLNTIGREKKFLNCYDV